MAQEWLARLSHQPPDSSIDLISARLYFGRESITWPRPLGVNNQQNF